MTDEQDKTPSKPDDLVTQRLVNEAGITEEQARALIAILGAHSWSSLMREARLMAAQQR
ncbi:hypothetical protein [Mesorhizobium sp. P5_C1]